MKRLPGGQRKIAAPPGFYGCVTCGQIKPVSEFHRSTKGPDGHSSHCKPCKVAKGRAHRERLAGVIRPHDPDRFWKKVWKTDSCWLWTANLDRDGYGNVEWKGKWARAHRVAWELAYNEPPADDKNIDHLCKNRSCVNVAHMRLVDKTTSTLENTDNYCAVNKRKTHCLHEHPLSGENLATRAYKSKRRGKVFTGVQRICLTCYPQYWYCAVIPRSGPPPRGYYAEHRRKRAELRVNGEGVIK